MAKGQTPENAYSEGDRKAALELAASVGVKPAAQHLSISRATIYRWIDMYPKYWSDLRGGNPEAQRRNTAHRLEDLADRYTAAEHDLLDRVENHLIARADAKEAAALIKALGSSRQAATVGARTTLGEPEKVEHTINFPQIEQAMERILAGAQPQPALPVANEAEAD
jgi:hypothetical protein